MYNLNGKKVLLFGDSIMFGSGNYGTGVGEYLEKKFGIKLYKYCIGGARVGYQKDKSWVVEQLRQAISDRVQPDVIVFDGFTNDCNMSDGKHCDVELGEAPKENSDIFAVTKSDNFSTCFESVAAALKKYFPEAKYLFIRPHKMGRRDAVKQVEYGERAVEICKKNGISVADIYNESILNTFLPEHRDEYTFDSYGWGKGDCTHPNAHCYEKIYMPLIERAIKNL